MPSQTTTQENTAAGVTPSAPWRVQAVSVLPGHRRAVTFRDGMSGIVDRSAIKTATNAGIFAALAVTKMWSIPFWAKLHGGYRLQLVQGARASSREIASCRSRR